MSEHQPGQARLCVIESLKPASVGFSDHVFEQLSTWHGKGLKTALVTLVNIEGSSPRPLGSQLAVNELGEYFGLISGGCLESALVSEALSCINNRISKCVRYGRDSDYFDIQLPCGSGLDVLISPLSSDDAWLATALDLQVRRVPFLWRMDLSKGVQVERTSLTAQYKTATNRQFTRAEMDREFIDFCKLCLPKQQVVVIGDGEVFHAFGRVAGLMDIDLRCCSSSQFITALSENTLDQWTTLVLLSHEHSWEQEVLAKALQTDVGFITALGSKNTHRKRAEQLESSGFDDADLARIKSPAGIDIRARTPAEIAISICAELIATYRKKL